MNNILITSAGKRVSLTKKFMKELKLLFPDAKVYTTDMVPRMAPAGVVSDHCFSVPRCTSSSYIQVLKQICLEYQIKVLIPTIDTELLILSENREEFKKIGVYTIVSDNDFIQICRDKRKTAEFFLHHNIRVPEPRDKNNPVFPMFAKPYDGSLSANTHILLSQEDLTTQILNDPKLIFMEYINKNEYKEFTIDMYFGRDNRVKSIVPRERIEIRSGEINKGITRKNYLVDYLKTRISYLPGVFGCICLQLFYRESDNDVIGIEINPRFGGGYPLSYCAGANFPRAIIEEYCLGTTVCYDDTWRDGTLMLRYDDEIIVYE